MKKVLITALSGGGLVSCLLGAAPANADASRFQAQAQAQIPYVVSQYGMPAVLNEGYHICAWEAQGITGASDLNDRIETEMPMSRDAGIKLQLIAEHNLGC
jgi:hypothetical protein